MEHLELPSSAFLKDFVLLLGVVAFIVDRINQLRRKPSFDVEFIKLQAEIAALQNEAKTLAGNVVDIYAKLSAGAEIHQGLASDIAAVKATSDSLIREHADTSRRLGEMPQQIANLIREGQAQIAALLKRSR